MRLSEFEKMSIKKSFEETFEKGKIYLFGSRVDDTKRGGDIDLYLIPDKKVDDIRQRKRRFLIKLEERIGEQKIDVIIAKERRRTIEQVALRDGIEL